MTLYTNNYTLYKLWKEHLNDYSSGVFGGVSELKVVVNGKYNGTRLQLLLLYIKDPRKISENETPLIRYMKIYHDPEPYKPIELNINGTYIRVEYKISSKLYPLYINDYRVEKSDIIDVENGTIKVPLSVTGKTTSYQFDNIFKPDLVLQYFDIDCKILRPDIVRKDGSYYYIKPAKPYIKDVFLITVKGDYRDTLQVKVGLDLRKVWKYITTGEE